MLPPLNTYSNRTLLRRTLRAQRRALSVCAQKKSARQLVQKLRTLTALKSAQRIALYWPLDGEIDARRLRLQAALARHEFYLPLLRNFPRETLAFARWHPGNALHRNRFNIPEPRGRAIFSAQQMDVILLPLTGFDANLNRLGMGGGFYDKTLAFKHRSGARKPVLIGVAHACQQVEVLPAADWDVALDMVVTDQHIFR